MTACLVGINSTRCGEVEGYGSDDGSYYRRIGIRISAAAGGGGPLHAAAISMSIAARVSKLSSLDRKK